MADSENTSVQGVPNAGVRFMVGVSAFADLVELAYEREADTPIEAADREGAPQWRRPVLHLLNELHRDQDALEGFAAALGAFIAPTRHSSWGDAADYFRSLTFERIEGVHQRRTKG